jgi:hypothetical protein
VAVVKFKETDQGFSLFEGNDGKQGVARKGQIECGSGAVGSAKRFADEMGGIGFAVFCETWWLEQESSTQIQNKKMASKIKNRKVVKFTCCNYTQNL